MRRFLLMGLVLALGGTFSGCNEGQAEEGEQADETSGGEDGRDELEAPPGSRGPGEDEMPEGDLETEAGQGTGSPSGETGEAEEPSSPWGTPEAETGRPLPPRRPMSSTARSHYQRGLQLASA